MDPLPEIETPLSPLGDGIHGRNYDADYLVSEDEDLLVLGDIRGFVDGVKTIYPNVQVITKIKIPAASCRASSTLRAGYSH